MAPQIPDQNKKAPILDAILEYTKLCYILYILCSMLYALYSIFHAICCILYTIYHILFTRYYILYAIYSLLYTLLYSTIDYTTYFTIYSTLLCYTIPCCTVLEHALLYHNILYYTVSDDIMDPPNVCKIITQRNQQANICTLLYFAGSFPLSCWGPGSCIPAIRLTVSYITGDGRIKGFRRRGPMDIQELHRLLAADPV